MTPALIEAMARALRPYFSAADKAYGEHEKAANAALSALTSHADENGGTVHLGDDWMLIRAPEVRKPTEDDLEKARSLHLARSIEAVEAAGYVVAEVAQLQALFRECADTFREMGHPEIADRIDAAALLSARPRTTP